MLSANRVEIDAGALTIVSRQNTSDYFSRERSLGLSLSVNLVSGAVNGSANIGGGTSYGSFASVADQAGIRAGSGGFDIRVAGLTDLRGGVIGSTGAEALNRFRTGTLRSSSINNFERYNVSNFNFGGGFGEVFLGGTGQVNTTGGTGLFGSPFSFTIPTFLTAYGSQSSLTFSALSQADTVITSGEVASLAALGSLSRDTTITNSALTRQFTEARRAEIADDFAAARQLVTEVTVFFANRAAEQTRAEEAAIALGVERNPDGTVKRNSEGNLVGPTQAARDYITTASNARKNYGSGSAARLIGTAISGAAGGNVTGSLGSFVQAAAVNALQSLAVRQVKDIADSFFKQDPNYPNNPNARIPTVESEAVRTALQALVGCAGAAPTGNCASGALGASSSVVLNNLITSLLQPEARDAAGNIIPRSLADQQTRTALIATLTGAIAGAVGANAGVASNAGVIETEYNNFGDYGPCGPRQRGCVTKPVFLADPNVRRLINILQISDDAAFACATTSGTCAAIRKYKSKLLADLSTSGIGNADIVVRISGAQFGDLVALDAEVQTRGQQIRFLANGNSVRRTELAALSTTDLNNVTQFRVNFDQLTPTAQDSVRRDLANHDIYDPLGRATASVLSRVFVPSTLRDIYFATIQGGADFRDLGSGIRSGAVNTATPIASFIADTSLIGSVYDRETGERNPLFDTPTGRASLAAAEARNAARFTALANAAGNAATAIAQLASDFAPPPWAGTNGTPPRVPTRAEVDAYNLRISRGGTTLRNGIGNVVVAVFTPAINLVDNCLVGNTPFACGQRVAPAAIEASIGLATGAIGSSVRNSGRFIQTVPGSAIRLVRIDASTALRGTREFDILNFPPPNTRIELTNGSVYVTNAAGIPEEVTFQPRLVTGTRDARQTAVGRQGLDTDVGGHIQACSLELR